MKMKWKKNWVVFVTAPDQVTGEMWCSMIRTAGINCRLKDSNPSFIGPSLFPVRLMAPEDESERALQILESDVVLGPMNSATTTSNPSNRDQTMVDESAER